MSGAFPGVAAGLVVCAALAGAARPGAVVLSGLDVIARDGAGALRGKRVGLIANPASVTREGRASLEVLRAAGADVVRLYAPEHGASGTQAAGEKVPDGIDAGSGLPVVSLYDRPQGLTPDDLQGVEALVYDLQDAGVRFYTYESDLLLAISSAAAANVELVVLDRPNPLGGERVEGPVADGQVPPSAVNRAPGPLVHGLTAGELARLVNGQRAAPARLRVVPMEGWARAMTWADTGRAWVPPSPNLRSAEAAIAYPGTCLLEAATVTEGRGTDAPFLLLGAPWLDAAALRRAVRAPGFALGEAAFTPRASAAAPQPKWLGQACRGVRVRVTDARRARPYALGIALLHALRAQHGFAWSGRADHLDWLLGTRSVRAALERGDTPEQIVSADAAAIAAFRAARAPFLLY